MRTISSASTVQPSEWDKASSPDEVYHNYNVTETAASGDNPKLYHYDVDVYTKAEYDQLTLSTLQQAVGVLLGVNS